MAKSAASLHGNPLIVGASERPELPFNKSTEFLTSTDGLQLEIMTRLSSPMMAAAIQNEYSYRYVFGSRYIVGKIEQMERCAISQNGLGRREIIEALGAADRTPDAYYAPDGIKNNNRLIIEDDD